MPAAVSLTKVKPCLLSIAEDDHRPAGQAPQHEPWDDLAAVTFMMGAWAVRVKRSQDNCGELKFMPESASVSFSSEFRGAVDRHGPCRMLFGNGNHHYHSVNFGC
jgi:hypothetical protein